MSSEETNISQPNDAVTEAFEIAAAPKKPGRMPPTMAIVYTANELHQSSIAREKAAKKAFIPS